MALDEVFIVCFANCGEANDSFCPGRRVCVKDRCETAYVARLYVLPLSISFPFGLYFCPMALAYIQRA